VECKEDIVRQLMALHKGLIDLTKLLLCLRTIR